MLVIKPEIHRIAKEYDLNPHLVTAIVIKESGGVQYRCRYEPHTERYLHFHREYASRLGISVETEITQQKTSWGLMQVMGFVAREMKFNGYLVELCGVECGLRLGCMKFKSLLLKYGDLEAAVAAYNMGSPRKSNGGLYKNQKNYVDPIFKMYREMDASGAV